MKPPKTTILFAIYELLGIKRCALATFPEYELATRRRLQTMFDTFQKSKMAAGKPSVSVQKLFSFPVSTSSFVGDKYVSDVGQCGRCQTRVGHGRKCGDSRWNRFAICFRSKVISTSGFVADKCVSYVGRYRTMWAVSNSGQAWSKI